MLATPGPATQELCLVEADPELGPPEELLWPTWWGQRTWRPWWDWAQDRVRRSRAQASPACLERRDDERHCGPHVPDDELRGQSQDPIPEPPEHRISAGVSGPPPLMAAPVHLHDEPRSGSAEVRDVPQDGHLPPEHDAEPAAAELRPERSLRRRERETHAASPGGNERGVLGMKGTGHDDLPSPAEERGNAPQGAGSVTRASRVWPCGAERAPASRCPATARGEGVHWTRPAPEVAAPYIAPGPYPSFSYDALAPFCPPLWGPPPARSLAGGEASTELGRVPPARSEASTGGVHIRGPPRGAARFGKRYLNAQLGRWVSADPLALHAPGDADPNLYAYVHGAVLVRVDPVGLLDIAKAIVDGVASLVPTNVIEPAKEAVQLAAEGDLVGAAGKALEAEWNASVPGQVANQWISTGEAWAQSYFAVEGTPAQRETAQQELATRAVSHAVVPLPPVVAPPLPPVVVPPTPAIPPVVGSVVSPAPAAPPPKPPPDALPPPPFPLPPWPPVVGTPPFVGSPWPPVAGALPASPPVSSPAAPAAPPVGRAPALPASRLRSSAPEAPPASRSGFLSAWSNPTRPQAIGHQSKARTNPDRMPLDPRRTRRLPDPMSYAPPPPASNEATRWDGIPPYPVTTPGTVQSLRAGRQRQHGGGEGDGGGRRVTARRGLKRRDAPGAGGGSPGAATVGRRQHAAGDG